jgi:hypothetical protein
MTEWRYSSVMVFSPLLAMIRLIQLNSDTNKSWWSHYGFMGLSAPGTFMTRRLSEPSQDRKSQGYLEYSWTFMFFEAPSNEICTDNSDLGPDSRSCLRLTMEKQRNSCYEWHILRPRIEATGQCWENSGASWSSLDCASTYSYALHLRFPGVQVLWGVNWIRAECRAFSSQFDRLINGLSQIGLSSR